MVDYQELKNSILSRKELNRKIRSLKEFLQEGAESIIQLQSGEKITQWEMNEYEKSREIRKKSLLRSIEQIDVKKHPVMLTSEVNVINNISHMGQIEIKTGDNFKNLLNRVLKNGVLDYELKQSTLYQKNFYKTLEDCTKFKNYKLLEDKLKTIKNPIKFYEFVNKSEIFSDIFIWYNQTDGVAVMGNFSTDEEMFNYGLYELGIIDKF